MESAGTWILERCASDRFPYRLQLVRSGRPWLVLRCQSRWPGAGTNVFCLRERDSPAADEARHEVERVPIIAVQRRGVRLSVILDRPRYKRCDFLFLKRPYKDRAGDTHEQIFWQTQLSMRERRPKVRPAALRGAPEMVVAVAHEERYPWRFPGATAERGRLATGDYALVDGGLTLAVVERKTFDNLLANFSVMPDLHQRLLELSSVQNHALVVEAPYEDFISPRRLHHFSPAFCAAAIAELYVLHPKLRMVFCGNRKTANEWTRRYFAAVWTQVHPSPTSPRPVSTQRGLFADSIIVKPRLGRSPGGARPRGTLERTVKTDGLEPAMAPA